MSRGRPPLKGALVDTLAGSEQTRQRLRVILATVAGELTIAQACEQLGIGQTRFFELRRQALEGAMAGITAQEPGRPPILESADAARVRQLQEQIDELKFQLYSSRVRAELGQVLPHLTQADQTQTPPEQDGADAALLRRLAQKKRRPRYRR